MDFPRQESHHRPDPSIPFEARAQKIAANIHSSNFKDHVTEEDRLGKLVDAIVRELESATAAAVLPLLQGDPFDIAMKSPKIRDGLLALAGAPPVVEPPPRDLRSEIIAGLSNKIVSGQAHNPAAIRQG